MKGTPGPRGPAGGSALFWSAIVNAATSYFCENFYATQNSASTSRPSNRVTIPSSRAWRGLQVWLTAVPTKDVALTLYKNGAATALTLTIPAGQVYGEELTTQVTCVGGDKVSLMVSHTSGAPFTGRVHAYLGES